MGMHEGRARLAKTVRELEARWSETRARWQDSNSRAFEVKHILELEQDHKKALSAMDQMAQVLQKIKQDCQ